jgi:predicted P-loop ATPase
VVAQDTPYHPVREYLKALKWDGTPRLQIWLAEYLGAEADPVYLAAVGRKFLISAVARVIQPGCQVDHMLVLEGPQDLGKSRTARALARYPEWFTDDMPDIHDKDAALQLSGRWIVELAELAALRRSELEGMKAFITRPVDVFRPPYARRTVGVPRQSVFVGTTNEAHYLRDPTGNRRFWPVPCSLIDIDALECDRDQLWAEALHALHAGEAWHLTREETALANAERAKEISTRQVMIEALHLEPDKPDYVERAGRLGVQLAAAMQAAGWRKLRTSGRGSARRTIYGKPL